MAGIHTVVIDGSMAGHCCDRVTIIDRDAYLEGAPERRGVL
jgi:hypothetical protein